MEISKNSLDNAINNNELIAYITECYYGGINNILPETILETRDEINSIPLSYINEAFKIVNNDPDEEIKNDIADTIGIDNDSIEKMSTDQNALGKLIHVMKNKINEAEREKNKIADSKRGFLANLIVTLKRCLIWLIEKLKMVGRVGIDIISGKKIGTTQLKADFNYVNNKGLNNLFK